MIVKGDYDLYFRFIKTYMPVYFQGIRENDPIILKLEDLMEKYDQFFYIADLIDLKILYSSKRSLQMIGIKPELISPHIFTEVSHPDDVPRCNYGRNLIVKQSQEILNAGKGEFLYSADHRMRNASGVYNNMLVQCYLFFSEIPHKTVYFLKIHTNISKIKKTKSGSHYYVGNDLSYFHYPNQHLLDIGNIFSQREFEILQLIQTGLDSKKIAEKLCLSVYTVRTHRRNILTKTGKTDTAAVIYDLKERGML